ncbi:Gfo/Idh/MocA family protein [Alienimonas californiensis]|uniref:Putative oxidoreductase YcjS n=1 Tax=Alienimonas californiensis TaxID=2527989 RepID=A0A517PAH3_9PLAN|nr:Gfo/Idh/MocA family oxidoreductase [Alienimonas californiensis]QDT16370.1 putative oxidoreductase YcjS [Alienimonas californiensis]
MNPLRVGIIGLGIGRKHIEGYRTHPGCEVVALCDLDENRLSNLSDEFRIAGKYRDTQAMYAEAKLDVVSICTPNSLHRPLAEEAFAHGCHVLCEKPIATTAEDGEAMLAAAEAAGKRLGINFSFRFTAQAAALKARVDAGDLGDIYYGRTVWTRRRGVPGWGGWFGQKKLAGGGPLIDLGVHRLDLALWLMGYPEPEWVLGQAWNGITGDAVADTGNKFDVEDFAAGTIRFKTGQMLSIEASWAANQRQNERMETRLFGTRGGLVHENVGEGYDFRAELTCERAGALWDDQLHEPAPVPHPSMWEFIEAIREDKPHPADGREGLTVQYLLDALYDSAASGEPVKIGG